MKASTISYRVADFLRRHPPFDAVPESELRGLAAGGRVKFHEDGEILYRQGQSLDRYVYVIQQGTVRLLEETGRGEALLDLLGEGDLFGLSRFAGSEVHTHTARSESEVMVYALPVAEFEVLAREHPRVSRFLAAFLSVSNTYTPIGKEAKDREESVVGSYPLPWVQRPCCAEEVVRRHVPSCAPDLTLREAARRMRREQRPFLVVAERDGRYLGLVTDHDLGTRVAGGEATADAPVREVLHPGVEFAPPGLDVGAYLAWLIRARGDYLLITEHGDSGSPGVGVVGPDNFVGWGGTDVLAVARRLRSAGSLSELGDLRNRAETLIAGALTGRRVTMTLAGLADAFNALMFDRLQALIRAEMEEGGMTPPGLSHAWLLFGTAARRETLTRFHLDHGLVYADPPPERAQEVRTYFRELAQRVSLGLLACGFHNSAQTIVAGQLSGCRSLEEWGQAYAAWVHDPILNRAYTATNFFDLRVVAGDRALESELRLRIAAALRANPNFIGLLANDSMVNLPPLTFYNGMVVRDEGTYEETLDLYRGLIQPLVDVARVLTLEYGDGAPLPTMERLAAAASRLPEAEALLTEARETMRIALYHRARTALVHHTDGSSLDPAELDKYNRQLLKSGFRTILRLLHFVSGRYRLAPRR